MHRIQFNRMHSVQSNRKPAQIHSFKLLWVHLEYEERLFRIRVLSFRVTNHRNRIRAIVAHAIEMLWMWVRELFSIHKSPSVSNEITQFNQLTFTMPSLKMVRKSVVASVPGEWIWQSPVNSCHSVGHRTFVGQRNTWWQSCRISSSIGVPFSNIQMKLEKNGANEHKYSICISFLRI